ncbi:glucose-6-phosphate isomerase family protein [Allonocardiopsis opalescens]|uniref:glucose-6-phosphate isomerase n=1 Tax=Allonocardiopsis opalescens TaxID=1144618 RepID=A0A2T0Q0E3_9ACTN|nr:glucose-6-phosphate isomerase family protein [Allonocardiopsis opalescens]PRX97267.1 glucose-6-phosphate isomerase [Allonocardiopsis opalescens]
MPEYATQPVRPMRITFGGADRSVLEPQGPLLTRRMSDLDGLFADGGAWTAAVADGDPVVYQVACSPVPERPTDLPQSVTTIQPGAVGGEFHMTKGHMHPVPQGEIYLGLSGQGGVLMFDGERAEFIEMAEGVIAYIPPNWAHRSVNTGTEPYRFLAVYPGDAGHDYGWVLQHGMGHRVRRAAGGSGYRLAPYAG